MQGSLVEQCRQLSIFDWMYQPVEIVKPIRLIELFAGYGSQAMALERLGADFEHYRVVEWDKYAVASYNAVHGTNFSTTDIKTLKGEDLGIVEKEKYTYLLTYSFPCTDLSVAGAMRGMSKKDWEEGNSTRSGLLWEVERLLKETKELPQILLMENVPQVCSGKNEADFNEWKKFLESKGYTNYLKILNAKDYGVAQNRKRAYMVSVLGSYTYEFPRPIELMKTVEDYLEDEVDEKYYINNDKAKQLIENYEQENEIKSSCVRVGQISNEGSQCGTVYGINGLAPTLTAGTHGYSMGHILDETDTRKTI